MCVCVSLQIGHERRSVCHSAGLEEAGPASVGALGTVLWLAGDLAKESQEDNTAALDSVQLSILSPALFL